MGNRGSKAASGGVDPQSAAAGASLAAAEQPWAGAASAGASEAEPLSECPIPKELRNKAVYNVYNQRIDPAYLREHPEAAGAKLPPRPSVLDPTNNMPLEPNQLPAPGQTQLLSTSRQSSTIPKGGTDSTWLYPSPQMFFNALRRKGKDDDVNEEDMESVIFAHNTMNETTWHQVSIWESLHRAECGTPSLARFRGRPDDLSPLARLSYWFGLRPLPFDRHDWFVDRCGTEVRYVIDFYFDEDKAGSPDAFTLRVRPALDSPTAALDRIKMQIYTTFAAWNLPCPVTGLEGSIGKAANEDK